MGRLNANYGSELHLLRWLGRHRDAFNRKVSEATGLKVARWMDFGFSAGEKTYDAEIKGLSFLPSEIRKKLQGRFPARWCATMSWDAVGVAEDGTYILVEAKAAAGELKSSRVERDSGEVIDRQLQDVALKLGGNPKGWLGGYYQAANRIYVQMMLDEYVKAIQLNVFFCGDRRKGVRCPRSQEEWRPYIQDEFGTLGLSVDNEFVKQHVFELFLDVAHS